MAIVVLLGASVFFTVQVERTRAALRAGHGEALNHEAPVTVVAVIDGDELSVADAEGNRAVVRLLGIKAFNADRNDYVTRQYGQRSVEALRLSVGQQVKLTLGEPPFDKHKRLLAYADAVDGDAAEADLGRRQVLAGLVLAYVRYAHPREDAYLAAEVQAMRAQRGLWAQPAAAQRAQALKALWQEQRP